jgi:hypothetical protein
MLAMAAEDEAIGKFESATKGGKDSKAAAAAASEAGEHGVRALAKLTLPPVIIEPSEVVERMTTLELYAAGTAKLTRKGLTPEALELMEKTAQRYADGVLERLMSVRHVC